MNTCFRIHVKTCPKCGRSLRGRHAEQTSSAVGAAGVQIGPHALALAAHLNKTAGVSWGRIADTFSQWFGLKVRRSTLCRAAVERLARKLRPTYDALVERLAAEIRGRRAMPGSAGSCAEGR